MSGAALTLTTVIAASLALTVRSRSRLERSWGIIRRLRPWMFVANLPVIAAVITTTLILYRVPWLQWGWLSSVTGQDGNVNLIGMRVWWLAPLFGLLLALAIPLLAEDEEETFRAGTRTWPQAIRRSIIFGLVHLVAGIPVAAALALTLAGLWFSRQYFLGGVKRATAYHTAWNYTALAIFTTFLLLGGFS